MGRRCPVIPALPVLLAALAMAPLPVLAGEPAAVPPGEAKGSEGRIPAVDALAERVVLLEVAVPAGGGKERILLSLPALVTGPRIVVALAPRLEGHLATPGAAARISRTDSGGTRRTKAVKLIRLDPRTGMALLEIADARRVREDLAPTPAAQKDAVVYLVEPGRGGRPLYRRGRLLLPRVYLDQGRGQNPLLLAEFKEAPPEGRALARTDDDLASACGALVCDAAGGFLGILAPPCLGGAAPGAKDGKDRTDGGGADPEEPADLVEAAGLAAGLREGEILLLPGAVVHYLAHGMAGGKAAARGYLGASFREVPRPPEEVLKLGSSSPGIRVERIVARGPAAEAGLKAGDWLVAICEKRPVVYADVLRFAELVEYGGQGRTMDLAVVRVDGGRHELLTLKVRIGSR